MIVSPSILSADFSHLLDEVNSVASCGAEFLHVDVMDGHFVPNITMGAVVLKSLKDKTSIVKDVHLMIENPLKYVESFVKAGADIITIHYEAISDLEYAINYIKKLGVKVGVSIKPNTDVKVLDKFLKDIDLVLVMSVEPGFGGQAFMEESLPKIKYLSEKKKNHQFHYMIEVDGGINLETAKKCKDNGCEIVVAGTYIFNSKNRYEAIEGLLKL